MLGEQRFNEQLERLSVNDLWLLMHMVIAFWHTFGMSNGLKINPETDLQAVQYREGPDGHCVKAAVMQAKLDEYIRWLEHYQQSWGTARFHEVHPAAFLRGEIGDPDPPSWRKVVKMIELLQIGSAALPSPLPDREEFAPLVAFLLRPGTDKGKVEITEDEDVVRVLYEGEVVFSANVGGFVDAFFRLFGIEYKRAPGRYA